MSEWFFFLMFILFILRERKRERVRVGEGQRERIPSRLHSVSVEPDVRLKPTNCEIMT